MGADLGNTAAQLPTTETGRTLGWTCGACGRWVTGPHECYSYAPQPPVFTPMPSPPANTYSLVFFEAADRDRMVRIEAMLAELLGRVGVVQPGPPCPKCGCCSMLGDHGGECAGGCDGERGHRVDPPDLSGLVV